MNDSQELQKKSLKGKLSFLLKDSVLYGGATALARMLNIFTLPILTSALSTIDYGAYDGIRVLSQTVLMFCILGLDQASSIMTYNYSKKLYKKGLFGHALILIILISTTLTVVLFFLAKDILLLYMDTDQYTYVFKLVIVSIPFMAIFQFSQSTLKWNFKRKEFLIITIGFIILFFLQLLGLYVADNINLKNLFICYLISYGFFGLLGLFFIKNLIVLNLRWKYSLPLLIFGLPFFVDSTLAAFIPALDRYFIANRLSLGQVALYAVAFRITSLLRLARTGVQVAWGPFAMSLKDNPNAKKTFSLALIGFGSFMIFSAALITINSSLILELFVDESYISASVLFLPLSFAIVVSSYTMFSGYGIIMSGKTYLNTVTYVSQLLATILFIILLIDKWGILGVAYAILFSQIVLFILRSIFSYRNYKKSPKLLIPIILLLIGYVTTFLLHNLSISLLMKNTIIILILLLLSIVVYSQRVYFKKILRE